MLFIVVHHAPHPFSLVGEVVAFISAMSLLSAAVPGSARVAFGFSNGNSLLHPL
jgi:hypothetical protein